MSSLRRMLSVLNADELLHILSLLVTRNPTLEDSTRSILVEDYGNGKRYAKKEVEHIISCEFNRVEAVIFRLSPLIRRAKVCSALKLGVDSVDILLEVCKVIQVFFDMDDPSSEKSAFCNSVDDIFHQALEVCVSSKLENLNDICLIAEKELRKVVDCAAGEFKFQKTLDYLSAVSLSHEESDDDSDTPFEVVSVVTKKRKTS